MCLGADQFAGNDLVSSGAVVKRSRREALENLDHVGNHVEMKRCHLQQFNERFQRLTPPARPPEPDSQASEPRGPGVHAKALRIRAFWFEIGKTPECPASETSGPGKSHTQVCKAHQDAWEESRQTSASGGGETWSC